MKRIISLLFILGLLIPTQVQAQRIIQTGTITTSGADCSTATNCVVIQFPGSTQSVGIRIDISATATVQFEYTTNSPNVTQTWQALIDDVNAASSTTSAGSFFFSNPGYVSIRVRASANTGTVTVTANVGYTGLRSTATVSGGGGPADVGVSTAASETDAARQKVTSALRLLDTTQGAGTQLVGAKGDQTSGMWVNCKAGCTSASDTTGATVTLNALNTAALVALAGENAVSVAFTAGASPVLTAVADCSVDGGTTYTGGTTTGTVAFVTSAGIYSQGIANPGNTTYSLILPPGCAGATHIRVRAGAYTSGTVVAQLRATANSPYANPALAASGATSYPNALMIVGGQDSATPTTTRPLVLDTTNNLLVNPKGFPASAALADATANPTTTSIGSYNMCYNGATWDRCKSATLGNGTNTTAQLVTIASDSTGQVKALGHTGAFWDSATGTAPVANAVQIGGLASGATGGFVLLPTVCDLDQVINISTATTTLEITGVASRKVRICAFNLVTAAANNVAFIEGTGATCGTGTAGMAGGTTAASGFNLAANGGMTQGSGFGEIMTIATAGDSVCLVTSAATQLSGHIKYTIY